MNAPAKLKLQNVQEDEDEDIWDMAETGFVERHDGINSATNGTDKVVSLSDGLQLLEGATFKTKIIDFIGSY